MNELGGVGEKDLHQCEEEFLPQKSIEAGSFILFFVYPRSLGECFIADPTLIPKFDDGEGVDQGVSKGNCASAGYTHRSDGQYHKQYHSPRIVFPFSTDTNEGVVIK